MTRSLSLLLGYCCVSMDRETQENERKGFKVKREKKEIKEKGKLERTLKDIGKKRGTQGERK